MAEHGGQLIGRVLAREGVRSLFTLCGGHISPLLVGAKAEGIRVVDVRDEASAVFAADAVARMTGLPGVAAVTAGPGVTNTITAVKNAQMAQSPVLIFGGATPTVLKGRGALQDIDQLALMKPITKWAASARRLPQLSHLLRQALRVAREGVPGPVFLEVPVDLLYPEAQVRDNYFRESGVEGLDNLRGRAIRLYLRAHLLRQFHQPQLALPRPHRVPPAAATTGQAHAVAQAVAALQAARRPALVIGSQALVNLRDATPLADAVRQLGVPCFLGGMARGLLGRHSEIQFRHHRSAALKQADVVVVAGFPFDFRLNYGMSISSKATLIAANLSRRDLHMNRRPDIGICTHPGELLLRLAEQATDITPDPHWLDTLREREAARDREIRALGDAAGELVNPLRFFLQLEDALDEDAVIVVDGGDFVATASYILRPRAPLSWLDPGVFGTLGVGGGFTLGAACARPGAQIWLIYGDGSSAYSLAEFDTYSRHGMAPIAVVGTDGAWGQIAREQQDMLGDDVGTVLSRSDYHRVAEGYGGKGLLLRDPDRIAETLDEARAIAADGKPVCINVHLQSSAFRKGSISM